LGSEGKYISESSIVDCEDTGHEVVVTAEIFGGGFVDDVST
jgi:hypothetical protein